MIGLGRPHLRFDGTLHSRNLFRPAIAALLAVVVSTLGWTAGPFHAYVGRITSDSFLLAWGTTGGGGNTIGRRSRSMGAAEIKVQGRTLGTTANWIEVPHLAPDTDHAYELWIDGQRRAAGVVRTLPRSTSKLSFMVIGDYGNGSASQYTLAQTMHREILSLAGSQNPVRFVLTTGDNIYSTRHLGIFPTSTGLHDRDWEKKFFRPYAPLLKSVPFFPTLGNHDLKLAHRRDGGEVSTYLDNFFFPVDTSQRYYSFSVGELADFFALDTNTMSAGRQTGDLEPKGRQYEWLAAALAASRAPWKIAYFHHPPFSAGPTHSGSEAFLRAVMELFSRYGVQVVFSGHEHNFQISHRNDRSGLVQYVVSGGGGQLRSGSITDRMMAANIAAAASQRHFLLVEIDNDKMNVTPLGTEPIEVRDRSENLVPMPLTVVQ